MRTAVSDGYRSSCCTAGAKTGAQPLLDLLTAVETNDLQMREFLAAFRAGLNTSQVVSPSPVWTLLRWVVGSLEKMFQGCEDPAEAILLEARHADKITLHFELMRSILHGQRTA